MAPRTIYANLADGLSPLSQWDQSLADMGKLGAIPCTAAGTNAVTLTQAAANFSPIITAYQNFQLFSFTPAANSSGLITVRVGALASLNLYRGDGVTQATTGDLISTAVVIIAYNSALNAAAGGFQLIGSSNAGAAGGTNGQVQVNVSGALGGITISGDATLNTTTGVLTIANNAVSNAKFRQGSAVSVVGVTGNATANVADIQGTANQFLGVNSAGNALAFQTMSGDATLSGPALTIAANAVTNAKMATMPANTLKANATASPAVPTDVDISALTTKASPTSGDWLLLSDQAASGALKKAAFPTATAAATGVILFSSTGCVGNGLTDDTVNFQALLTANPLNAVLDGQGKTYKITAAVTIPASSNYLKIQNANFLISGDVSFLSVASGSATFFEMDTVLITAAGQTTTGRRCIDFSRMANFTFRKVWINATANKSICWYGAGTGGVSPYYGVWDHCYAGNFNFGIQCDDAGGGGLGVNSNTIYCCRLQPQTGNFGIYLGAFSQNMNIIGCDLESTGGTGIYMDGTGHLIEGTRFESQTTGISVLTNATNCMIGLNYYSSNTTAVSFAGSSRGVNTILYDPATNGTATFQNGIISTSPTGGVGYGTGAGGTVTQLTSRATAVTLNKASGGITLFSAAGSAAWASFLVNNSVVGANDTVSLAVTGAGNAYVAAVSSVSAGAFIITFSSVIGTAVDAPVMNFNVVKGGR